MTIKLLCGPCAGISPETDEKYFFKVEPEEAVKLWKKSEM